MLGGMMSCEVMRLILDDRNLNGGEEEGEERHTAYR